MINMRMRTAHFIILFAFVLHKLVLPVFVFGLVYYVRGGLVAAVVVVFVFVFVFVVLTSIDDHAVVSFGSTQHSLSSSLSESSDSDNSMATRRASIDATSWNALVRSFSFCSIFSTLRNLMPAMNRTDLEIEP